MNADPTTSTNGGTPPRLPAAVSHRWRPMRSGLLNLYRYDNEEFWFEQGRLLLRGNNGTGKSRVLALQLPFLLDGETAPHRLEPDGDPAKRIEWNLLMGKYADRLGYTWIEFGRRDESGALHYLTLGCGLHATEGRGLIGRWFFTTTRRIGEELSLQTADGYPLTRDRLSEALGADGEIFTTAVTYRAAVDAALFQLGEHRYSALVGLLVQLRQPQLSRQLDETRLSSALSEALRPLPSGVVADVAEAFRSLESDRTTLDAFGAARRGTETFLGEYRRYAQIAARRRAERVRTTHAAYETTMRRLRAAEATLEAARREEVSVAIRVEQLALDDSAAASVVDTLRASPQMRNADALHAARQMAADKERHARLAHDALTRATTARAERDNESTQAEHAASMSQLAFERAATDARERATAAGAEREHEASVNAAFPAKVVNAKNVAVARRELAEAVDRRTRASRHVRALNEVLGSARRAYESAKDAYTRLSVDLDNAVDAHDRARQTLAAAIAALLETFAQWAEGVVELIVDAPANITEELDVWTRVGEGKSPTMAVVSAAASAAANRFAALRASVEHQKTAASALLDGLHEERDQLLSGHHLPPPPPHTRSESARDDRPGAPLWRLCDFRPEVPPDLRAGIEAALEASGLLDAWVMPDGRLLAPGEFDTVLALHRDGDGVPSPDLHSLLMPSVERTDPLSAQVTDETVAALLARIGLGDGSGYAWVDGTGRWRIGPLHGAWTKPSAQHIGESAREARRRARLASVALEIADGERTIARLDDELRHLAERERVAHSEADAAPDDGIVRRAIADVGATSRRADELRVTVRAAETVVAEAHRAMTRQTEERNRAALDLGVTAWIDNLQELDDAIADYRASISELLNAAERSAEQLAQRDAALRRAIEANEDESRCRGALDDARRRAADAAAERDTLESSVGAAVDEILARLGVAARDLEQIRAERRRVDERRTEVLVLIAQATTDASAQTEMLTRETAERQTAIAGLESFARTRLLAVCNSQLSDIAADGWSITRAVDAARRIEAALSATLSDDDAWRRSQEHIHRHVQALTEVLLPYGYDPATEIADDVFVVTASFQGRRCTMAELRAALDEEITNRQALLNAREREILENHLVGEVAQHLHELLREGERNVQDMNRELRERPTSTGMTLRFVWQPADDGPPEFPGVRKHLLRAGATWSLSDREALGAFLQRRIQVVRAANETGTWQEHLSLALDYRSWHQFTVERQQDGQWKRLTRRTHGTGSGGEKAIALTIPQFAAAAAHYRTAHPLAPRLILLDEAFVGIDTDMRSKSMGLLHAFDLDFVMTSEREWGCYATLPGVAIYQLATRAGVDAVGVTRWVWNGRQRVRADHPTPLSRPIVAASPRHTTEEIDPQLLLSE